MGIYIWHICTHILVKDMAPEWIKHLHPGAGPCTRLLVKNAELNRIWPCRNQEVCASQSKTGECGKRGFRSLLKPRERSLWGGSPRGENSREGGTGQRTSRSQGTAGMLKDWGALRSPRYHSHVKRKVRDETGAAGACTEGPLNITLLWGGRGSSSFHR